MDVFSSDVFSKWLWHREAAQSEFNDAVIAAVLIMTINLLIRGRLLPVPAVAAPRSVDLPPVSAST